MVEEPIAKVHVIVLAIVAGKCDGFDMKKAADAPAKRFERRSAIRARAQAFFPVPNRSGRHLDVNEFCNCYQVTQETFTRLTGFSPRAVAHWAKGRVPSDSTQRRLAEVKRIFTALEKLTPPETIGRWLDEPNAAFDGSTPLQVIERGESDRIWRMIYELESGEPG